MHSLALLALTALALVAAAPPASIPLGSRISARDAATWTSPSRRFSLGFLPDSRDSAALLLAIWHTFPTPVPVWTAGAGACVSPNSFFLLSPDGSLELHDGPPAAPPLWSSATAAAGVRAALLSDDGNLVLLDADEKAVWESFACPTDTLLPGQPLRFPSSLRGRSTGSLASYYTLRISISGVLSLAWESNVTYWTSGGGSGGAVEARLEPNGLFGLFSPDSRVVWSRVSKDFSDLWVEFRRLRIDLDGNLRMYSWDNASSSWTVSWQAVQDQCGVFGSCGLYGICTYGPRGPVCECLSPYPAMVALPQCPKMADLTNCEAHASISVLDHTVLYSLYPPHDVEFMLSSQNCRDYCFNDSSCFAATSLNDGSGRCTVKRTGFISGYRHSSVHATSFLKVCSVPEAVSAQVARSHGDAMMPLPVQPSSSRIIEHRNVIAAIVVLLLVTALVFLAAEMFVFWYVWYRRRKVGTERRIAYGKEIKMNPHYSAVVRLSLEQVKELTKNFTTKLGPSVYRGILPNKVTVAVKLLDNVAASERDFQILVSTLGSTHHRNLVALKGFCYESEQKLLLYEYVGNGSLDQWLLDRKQSRGRDNWHQRLNIAIGIARGLAYLHLECKQCISHGHLRLKNILLDDYLVAKIADFGIANLLEKGAASSSETPSEKDVYEFGGVLLQIVTGSVDNADEKICDLAYKMCTDGALADFVDAHLDGKVEQEGVQRVVRLALWCMQDQPALRPSIGEVVMVLEGAVSLDMPPRPQASITG